MSGLESIAIKILTSTPILVALGGIVLFVILYLLYRRPNPPLSPLYRILLPALRAIALLALVVALLETIVGFDWNISRSRRVAVLIDGSASMDHVELGKSRRARLDSLLSTESYAQWRNDVEVERYYFAGNMTESPSELLTDRTAITDALQALAADPVGGEADSWFLLTDGRSNSGRLFRPQVATALPKVYAVGMSEGAGSIDLAVESLELNPLLYSGVKSEAVVQVRASRATDGPVTLSLKEGDRELASQMIPGIPDDGRATVRLAFTPGVPGDAIYRLVVTPQSGEQNSANNERGVAVTVLKSKHQILIVTQTLDYEIGFLRRKLEGTNKCEIDLRVIGSRGNLARPLPGTQAEWNRYDLVVLYDLPGSLLQASVPLLKSYMSDRGGSLWWHFGPTFARAVVSASLREILPVSPKQAHTPVYREFHAMPVEGNLLHPAIRLGDDGASTRDAWNELPPFRQLIRADSITPRAVVLAETRVDSADLPVLAFLRIGAGKSLVSSAQPFWRWSLASEPYTAMADPHGEYVTGNLGWLTTREDSEPIRIVPDRRIVMRGEEVGFSGTAYDVGYRPLDDVAGTVTLRDSVGNALPEVRMTSRGDGTYRASLRGVAPGRYTYRGQFARGAEILRTQEGEIVVEPFSLEEQDLGDGRELLSQVSASTGGGFFEWRQFEQALAALPRGLVQEQKSGEFPLWSSRWLLFLMVLCLGLEWGIRKARGLL